MHIFFIPYFQNGIRFSRGR